MSKCLLVYTFLLLGFCSFSQMMERNISSEKWTFNQVGETANYEAKLPGNIYLDLYRNQLIPHPFYGINETKVQWVDSAEFEYQTEFFVSETEINHDFAELVFEGLDTYSQVYLNNQLVATTDNMFISWRIDAKSYLRKGKNLLRIHFQPAMAKAEFFRKADSINRPEYQRVYIRKAQYMFGWDWGARLVGVGIWKDIKLKFWNNA